MSCYIGQVDPVYGNRRIVHFSADQRDSSVMDGLPNIDFTTFHSDYQYFEVEAVHTFDWEIARPPTSIAYNDIDEYHYTSATNVDVTKPLIVLCYINPISGYYCGMATSHQIGAPEYDTQNWTVTDICTQVANVIKVNHNHGGSGAQVIASEADFYQLMPAHIKVIQLGNHISDIDSVRPTGDLIMDAVDGVKIGTKKLFEKTTLVISDYSIIQSEESFNVYSSLLNNTATTPSVRQIFSIVGGVVPGEPYEIEFNRHSIKSITSLGEWRYLVHPSYSRAYWFDFDSFNNVDPRSDSRFTHQGTGYYDSVTGFAGPHIAISYGNLTFNTSSDTMMFFLKVTLNSGKTVPVQGMLKYGSIIEGEFTDSTTEEIHKVALTNSRLRVSVVQNYVNGAGTPQTAYSHNATIISATNVQGYISVLRANTFPNWTEGSALIPSNIIGWRRVTTDWYTGSNGTYATVMSELQSKYDAGTSVGHTLRYYDETRTSPVSGFYSGATTSFAGVLEEMTFSMHGYRGYLFRNYDEGDSQYMILMPVIAEAPPEPIQDPPVVSLVYGTGDRLTLVNEPITLVGQATSDEGTIVSAEWRAEGVTIGTSLSVDYTPTTIGVKELIFLATDNVGQTSHVTTFVTAFDALPGQTGWARLEYYTSSLKSSTEIYAGLTAQWDEYKLQFRTTGEYDGSTNTPHPGYDYFPTLTGTDGSFTTIVNIDGHDCHIFYDHDEGDRYYLVYVPLIGDYPIPSVNGGSNRAVEDTRSINMTMEAYSQFSSINSYRWLEGATVLSQTYTFSYTGSGLGDHTLTAEATDALGNVGTDTVVVTVVPYVSAQIGWAEVQILKTVLPTKAEVDTALNAAYDATNYIVQDLAYYDGSTTCPIFGLAYFDPLTSFSDGDVAAPTAYITSANETCHMFFDHDEGDRWYAVLVPVYD